MNNITTLSEIENNKNIFGNCHSPLKSTSITHHHNTMFSPLAFNGKKQGLAQTLS